jgi:hypothetical protein
MNAENYSMVDKNDDIVLDLLFNKGLTVSQTKRELDKMGISKSINGLNNFKQKVMERIIKDDRAEHMVDYVLESGDRVKIEFNDMMDKTKKLLKQAEEENKPSQQLEIIKEIRAQLETALRRQGDMSSSIKQSITNIQQNNYNTSDIMDQMEKIKLNWFETGKAEIVDGKIIFNNPPAEMVDLFKKWKFSQEFSRAKVIDIGR